MQSWHTGYVDCNLPNKYWFQILLQKTRIPTKIKLRTQKGNELKENQTQTIALAALAILGHKSAHSFPIGPVIADPFISPLGFTITPALSSKYM